MNNELEKAARVADFIELADLMAHDALDRNESCGGHLRVESMTAEGEAKRMTNILNMFLYGNTKVKIKHRNSIKKN